MSDLPPSPGLRPGWERPSRYGEVCVLLDRDEAVVWLHGDIDFAVREELDGAVTDLTRAGLPVRVDASKLTFCDSSAVHFLAALLRAGLSVRVHDPSDRLAWLLEVLLAPAPVLDSVRSSQLLAPGTGAARSVEAPSPTAAQPQVADLTARVVRLRRARRQAQRLRAGRL